MKQKANLASFFGVWLDDSTVHAAISKIHLLIQKLRVCTSCHDFHWIPKRLQGNNVTQGNNALSNAT